MIIHQLILLDFISYNITIFYLYFYSRVCYNILISKYYYFERIKKLKNIKINALASITVNILNIIFPLITNPYLTRILSKDSYGYFNNANTWASFVIPIAAFGIYNYGIRSVSKVKDNKDKINYVFSKLFYLSVFTSLSVTLLYFLVIELGNNITTLKILYYILGTQALIQFLNIEWMNEAYENYTFILYKTLFIRILMLASIFIFIKNEDDIIPYALIMTAVTFINYLISFIWIKKEVSFVKIPIKDIVYSSKSMFIMLLLANANMLYTLLDRLFITQSPNLEYISYYTISMNIVMLITVVLTGTINVTIPRLSYYLGKKDQESYEYLINKSSSLFLFFIIPIGIGLTLLGTFATVIYASDKYTAAGIVTSLFAVRTLVWSLEYILGNQIIFVNDKEKTLTLYYFIGGIINFILNTILYLNNIFQAEYYVITTLIAETIVVIFEIIFIRKYSLISLKDIFQQSTKYILVSLGFIPIYYIFRKVFQVESYIIDFNSLLMISCTIFCSACYYILTLLITKDSTLTYTLNIVLNKLKNTIK